MSYLRLTAFAMLMLSIAGCKGILSDPPSESPPTIPPDVTPTPEQCDTAPPPLRGVPTRLLTSREMNNALGQLFPSETLDDVEFRYDGRVAAFVLNSRDDVVEDHIREFRVVAESVAAHLVTNLDAIMGCAGASDRACVERYVPELATRAFRRPVSSEESRALMTLYDRGAARGHDEGMRYVFEAVLQAPSFIYVHETPADVLSAHEVAQRLSAMFARTVPDDELLAAAEDGSIMSADVRVRHAERLLVSDLGREALRAFASEWFGLDGLRRSELAADEPALTEGLIRETELFVDDLMSSDSASYTELLSARHTFLNDAMAAHYGVSLDGATDVGDGWYRVPSPEASGVLTQGSFLSQHAGPVHRGLTIRSLILCGNVPGPDGIDITQIEVGETESDRSKTEKRLEHPVCGGCHQMMDPIGLVFDQYDVRGVIRAEDEHGNLLYGDGELIATDVDGPVSSPGQLGDLLAGSEDVRECVAKQVFAWSYGREADPADSCMIREIRAQLDDNDDDLRRALVGIVATDQFVRSTGGSP